MQFHSALATWLIMQGNETGFLEGEFVWNAIADIIFAPCPKDAPPLWICGDHTEYVASRIPYALLVVSAMSAW